MIAPDDVARKVDNNDQSGNKEVIEFSNNEVGNNPLQRVNRSKNRACTAGDLF